MLAIFTAIAFAATLLSHSLRLPTLLGLLLVGMVLHQMGVSSPQMLEEIGDLGVTLLLFTIGLKLKVKQLIRPVVWGSTAIHAVLWSALCAILFWLLRDQALFGHISHSSGQWILAFALSFSSTVFTVSVLERRGEAFSFYGRLSIGILVMQDVLAVIYLSSVGGHALSPWAMALPLLWLARPLFYAILSRSGHNESLILGGMALALLPGAALFESVGLKADLGALFIGMVLAGHPKAEEMSRTLFNLKELFLVAFFLHVGLSTTLTWEILGYGLLLTLLLPLKQLLFAVLMLAFRTRWRTAFNGSLALTTYSEFALIIGAVAVENGQMTPSVLTLLAVAVSLSFILSAPAAQFSNRLFSMLTPLLQRYQRPVLLPEDAPITVHGAHFIILGMGRIGTGAYDFLARRWPDNVLGIDSDEERVQRHQAAGRRVLTGDATDSEFWDRLNHSGEIRLVFLAMPYHRGNQYAAIQLRERGYPGKVAAIATYPDDESALRNIGVATVLNIYLEAGGGLAEHALKALDLTPDETKAQGAEVASQLAGSDSGVQ